MHPRGKEVAVARRARRVHARLHSINGGVPLAPPPTDLPYLPGVLVVLFPLWGFHCFPGAGRVFRKGFWSKQGSVVEMQQHKVFWKSTVEEEFKPSALCQTKCHYPGLSSTS